jgi:hypothetical protein
MEANPYDWGIDGARVQQTARRRSYQRPLTA